MLHEPHTLPPSGHHTQSQLIDRYTLLQLIASALVDAQKKATAMETLGDVGKRNSKRSGFWVNALTEKLHEYCCAQQPQAEGSIVAFCLGRGPNPGFSRKEFLFDVVVAEKKAIKSASGGKELQGLRQPIWLVESEFQRSNSQTIQDDLIKLVAGRAMNKMLVISESPTMVKWAKTTLADLVGAHDANLFLVEITHPDYWGGPDNPKGSVYQLTPDGWLSASNQ